MGSHQHLHPSLFQLTSPKVTQFLPNWTLSPLPAGEAANKCLTSCHECLAVPHWLCVTWGVVSFTWLFLSIILG